MNLKSYKIKELGIIITGYTPNTKIKENYNSKDYMFVSPVDLKNTRYITNTQKYISSYAFNNSRKKTLRKGDIVVDCIGSDMGNVGIITNFCISNQQINAITQIKTNIVHNLYLYYLLSTKKRSFHQIGMNGSTMPIISKSLFEDIKLKIHDLKTQQHIVNTIGSIDDLIENCQKKIENLINNIKNIFTLFENEASGIFNDYFKYYNGGTFESKYYVKESKFKLITIKNIDDYGFNTLNVSFLDEKYIDDKYLLELGDLLLTMTGHIGRVGIVDEHNCYQNQRLLRIEASSKSYLLGYLLKYKELIMQLGKGTAQKNLAIADLQKLPVYNNKSEINNFKKYDLLYDLIVNYKTQIKILKNIKNYLLQKYF